MNLEKTINELKEIKEMGDDFLALERYNNLIEKLESQKTKLNKNQFYLVKIDYGRELAPECGACDCAFISQNKDKIINEFIQGIQNELSDNENLIIEDGTKTIEEIKEELTKAIDNKENYYIDFYNSKHDYNNGYEWFTYTCELIDRL